LMDIGKRIKELRQRFGLTQNELAQRADISQSTLSYLESGNKSPSIHTLNRICEALNVSLLDLINSRNSSFSPSSPSLKVLLQEAQELHPWQLQLIIELIKVIKNYT